MRESRRRTLERVAAALRVLLRDWSDWPERRMGRYEAQRIAERVLDETVRRPTATS